MLTQYLRKRVCVITTDGRTLVGVLHTADQLLNIVLTSCVERVLAPSAECKEPIAINAKEILENSDDDNGDDNNNTTKHKNSYANKKTQFTRKERIRERVKSKAASELKSKTMEEVPIGAIFIRGADVVCVAAVDVYAEAAHDMRSWRGMDLPQVNAPY